MQDDVDNVTRFLMLAREPIIPRTDRPFKVTFALHISYLAPSSNDFSTSFELRLPLSHIIFVYADKCSVYPG